VGEQIICKYHHSAGLLVTGNVRYNVVEFEWLFGSDNRKVQNS